MITLDKLTAGQKFRINLLIEVNINYKRTEIRVRKLERDCFTSNDSAFWEILFKAVELAIRDTRAQSDGILRYSSLASVHECEE